MKTFKNIGLVVLASIALTSCSNEDANINQIELPPSATAFGNIRQIALDNLTQHFTLNAGTGVVTFTSTKGVTISINGNCLLKNGTPVTGNVDIDFVELFDKGSMLATNKATMGKMPSGDKSLLLSGGEFYLNATQGNQQLTITCPINLIVPSNLTDTSIDNAMVFWKGNTTDDENLTWEIPAPATGPQGENGHVGFSSSNYYVTFGTFGWTNIDRFYNATGPKTAVLATVPTGYNNTNSAVYLSVDGEGNNQLAKFDIYNTTTGQFSEHYGQIPIGLQCHVIFATESNGQWRYAIKAMTTVLNGVTSFTLAETTVGTEAQMVAAINAIQ